MNTRSRTRSFPSVLRHEDDMNYTNSHRMKCLVCVFVYRDEVCAGFHLIMSTSRELFEIIQNENARKQHARSLRTSKFQA